MNALLHASWLPNLGWALLHSLWEGTLVALVTGLLLRGLRGATPRLRYAVAVMGLLLMVGLPLRHLLPSRHEVAPVQFYRGQSDVSPSFSMRMSAPAPVLQARLVGKLERALPWIVAAWGLGALLSFLRLTGGWAWLQRLRWRKAELAPDALHRQLLDLCRRSGLKRAVTLLMCEGLAGPSAVGILRPAILVPAGWFLNLPPDHVEALLAHELAHVLRHDYAVNLLESLLEVVLFYHPGLWWLSRRIRAERELACDTFAVRLMGDSFPLAEALTDLERRGLGRASFEPAPAAHGGSLMERIAHLLLPPRRTTSAPAFGAMTLMGLLLVASLRLAAQTPDPTPSVPPIIPMGHSMGDVVVNTEGSRLYIQSRNVVGADGKPIPYSQIMDVKAAQMPLNQIWKDFENVVKEGRPDRGSQMWDSPSEKFSGPLVNIDLNGVAPYQAPLPTDLPGFQVTKHTLKDGKVILDVHARQVSSTYLDTLLAEARRFEGSADLHNGSIGFDRDHDTFTGPKVDAIFEGLTLQELEVRIHKLMADSK